MTSSSHRVVIIGGGFGGLNAALALGGASCEVTLVDRRNFHLFQPLLYQVATGGLSPADISAPLREILKRHRNISVLMSDVVDLDLGSRQVRLTDGALPYDSLVVAAGARHHYFGNDWEGLAPGLKDVEDSTEIRSRVLGAFEAAELAADPEEARRHLTFVIVGAGPTGVELAGAVGELARYTLRREFRRIEPASARILLVEGADRVLPPFPPELSVKAHRALERLGVEIALGTRVEEISRQSVRLRRGGTSRTVRTGTVLWAAGVAASPLAESLARDSAAEIDRAGRVSVEPDLTLPGHPEVYALGDMIRLPGPGGVLLPGVAPVAMQQGRYVGKAIRRRLAGREIGAFRYRDRGSLAVIGRASAVADLGFARFSGYPAWVLWLFIHIMYLVGFANRALVLFQWAYGYLTRGRGARLIANAAASGPDRMKSGEPD